MATELYGVDAQLVASIGATPVSTETNVIFVGASKSGDLNKPVLITSMRDYKSKLGGEPGDGYNLSEAAIAAFQIAGISKVYMIPVSHDLIFDDDDYLGDASEYLGVYAIEKLLRDNPTAVNILCAPSVDDDGVIAALDAIAKKAAGHWQSFLMYDLANDSGDQIIEPSNVAQADTIIDDKTLADGHALAVWGHVRTSGGYTVSGAAIRACLQAKSDADYNAPGRSGGNLPIPGIRGVVIYEDGKRVCDGISATASQTNYITEDLEVSGTDVPFEDDVEYYIADITVTSGEIVDPSLVNHNGVLALKFKTGAANVSSAVVTVKTRAVHDVDLPEATATELSADGICSYIYYGNGVYHTWGDHTSLFAGGTVSDELYRFDNYIRVQLMILNRFQLSHRFEIDNPMDLAMRNDIITYEQDFLYKLKARHVLIGNPVVEFRAENNSTDALQQGRFVWSFECTETPPAKYLKAEVAYTAAGLSVLTEEE